VERCHCCSVRLTCRCTVWSAVLCQLQEPLTVPRLKTPHTLSIELTLASLKSPDKHSPYPLNSPNRRILITRFACSYHTSPSITLVRGGLILTPASWVYPHKYHGRSFEKNWPRRPCYVSFNSDSFQPVCPYQPRELNPLRPSGKYMNHLL
jgi:hypothetical protein